MICSKCKIDKPIELYQTYYHSTQQKYRTRRVCNSCFNEQRRKYKESIKNKKITQPEVPELEIEVFPTPTPLPEPDTTLYELPEVLSFMGYLYNVEYNVWLKPGVKEMINGELVFPKVKKYKNMGGARPRISNETKQEVIKYSKLKYRFSKIAELTNISEPSVSKIIRDYEASKSR